jgi:hypothetical protein
VGAEANRLAPEDAPVHGWYRFVLSFPPHLVRTYLDKFGIECGRTVLDPFCGTGTTVVECKKRGIQSIGVERNSVAFFATQVKTDWTIDPDDFVAHALVVAKRVYTRLKREGLSTELNLLSDSHAANLDVRLRHLPDEANKLLLRNSISPLPLHKTLVLLDEIDGNPPSQFSDHERLALAKALVSGIGNLQFGPEVGVGPPKADSPVVSLWMDQVRIMAEDLRQVQSLPSAPSHVYFADAREIGNILPANRVDAVITSPPYPNEKDYTRTTRLESVVLGFLRTKEDLRELKRDLVRSNTRGVYKLDNDDDWVSEIPIINELANAIERRRVELGKTSGFERMYPRVTKLYFGGMARHLADLRRILRPGANLAYVVGDQASYLRVMIRTGEILGQIAASLGYVVVERDLFRTRLATATKEQLREEVLHLRWEG